MKPFKYYKNIILLALALCLLALPCHTAQVALLGTTATTSGSVVAGTRRVEFIFSSNFAGTVAGVAFSGAADTSIAFQAPPGDWLPAITYTVTAGTVRIFQVQ